ncbi:MAG TPA: hypothetical protein VFS00_32470, partial [Polyangiaceae bacterium]|nr:hypothetical protein [Polyangiaceae bacterium]
RPRSAPPPAPSAPGSPPPHAPAWGGRYDDTQPEPPRAPEAPRFAPDPRTRGPEAPTRKYPPPPPPAHAAGPATTVSTTHEQIAAELEGDAKRLRESSAGTKVPAAFRPPPKKEK